MNIENQLRVEIANELTELGKLQLGSEEYRGTVDCITKLMDRALEMEKLNADIHDREFVRENENDLKQKMFADERRDRLVKNCLTAAGIVIPTIVTIWGTLKSIEFEKEGTITKIMGRGFIQKLLPKK